MPYMENVQGRERHTVYGPLGRTWMNWTTRWRMDAQTKERNDGVNAAEHVEQRPRQVLQRPRQVLLTLGHDATQPRTMQCARMQHSGPHSEPADADAKGQHGSVQAIKALLTATSLVTCCSTSTAAWYPPRSLSSRNKERHKVVWEHPSPVRCRRPADAVGRK